MPSKYEKAKSSVRSIVLKLVLAHNDNIVWFIEGKLSLFGMVVMVVMAVKKHCVVGILNSVPINCYHGILGSCYRAML
jgi:hypothetical protein